MTKMDLKDIQEPVKDLLEETNCFLKDHVKSDVTLINKIIDLTPISKGKKIRSTLLFLLAGMSDSLSPDLAKIAASIEMLHLSSLIHDDVVDNSKLRRGKKTINHYFGNFISVLWGDFLFINSLNIFNQIDRQSTTIILRCAMEMIEGQLLEAENSYNFAVTLDTYYDIIKKKTSSLFAGVAEIAATLNPQYTPRLKEFSDFGTDFGTIFQISDDMLDIFSDNSGKDRFRDLNEGKVTLPIILLLKENGRGVVEDFNEAEKDKLLDLIDKLKIEEASMKAINRFYDKCAEFLTGFPRSIYKDALYELLQFVKYRDY